MGLTLSGNLDVDMFNKFMGEFLRENSANLFRSKGVLAFKDQERKYVFQVRELCNVENHFYFLLWCCRLSLSHQMWLFLLSVMVYCIVVCARKRQRIHLPFLLTPPLCPVYFGGKEHMEMQVRRHSLLYYIFHDVCLYLLPAADTASFLAEQFTVERCRECTSRLTASRRLTGGPRAKSARAR